MSYIIHTHILFRSEGFLIVLSDMAENCDKESRKKNEIRWKKFSNQEMLIEIFKSSAILVPSHLCMITPLKLNMEPENGGLEDDFPLQLGDF